MMAKVAWGTEPMKLSTTGPSSTLPSFFFMAGGEEGGSLWSSFNYTGGRPPASPYEPSTNCPDDVFENTSPDLHVPKLPWRLQEDWGCEAIETQNITNVDVVVIESDALRAAITPQWGGKVWSLFDKVRGKQMLFNNPAHQPANIGYLKAWSSGGAEWNWSPGKIGHSAFTESPVWTAVLPTRLGPAVRVWEYGMPSGPQTSDCGGLTVRPIWGTHAFGPRVGTDRLNGTTWQVDVLLVNGTMFAHPKVSNPHPVELPGYWWTCVAMPVDSPRTRAPMRRSNLGPGRRAPPTYSAAPTTQASSSRPSSPSTRRAEAAVRRGRRARSRWPTTPSTASTPRAAPPPTAGVVRARGRATSLSSATYRR